MTDSVAHTSAEARKQGRAAEQWNHFLDDVIRRPTIGPVASWLILGLVTLVGWLTAQYAPGAATGAECGASAQQAASDAGVIPVNAGYGTVIAVTAITLIAGMQPVLEKRFISDWSGQLGDWFARQSWVMRAPVIFASRVLGGLFQVPSWLLSFADYLLARPIALIAGAGLSPFWWRYGVFLFWMGAAITAAWLLREPWGLFGFFGGVALVIGVVRRWNWVEADREAFFVARRQRKQNERIGFAEDLRDEALTALVFLFVLIPLGLRQVELMAPETFCINGASGADAGVLAWLGFFGAELAKSVPFVDWSEVFHVANGSPIEPNTVLGAQVVFAMRAMLDLLMIAAVVQAVQLASRLAEQNAAFAAGDINILEPFMERLHLHRLGAAIGRANGGHLPGYLVAPGQRGLVKVDDGNPVIAHPSVRDFPAYNSERLAQIVEGGSDRRRGAAQALLDPVARRAAVVLAAKQAVESGRAEDAVSIVMSASRDLLEDNRQLALRLAAESVPAALMRPAYDNAKLLSAKGGTIDVNALLQIYPERARPLAERAIRSALGEFDVMVSIPAGEFMMGMTDEEEEEEKSARLGGSGAKPRHSVKVAAFEMGKYCVTFEEFNVFCDATGYFARAMGVDRPYDNWGGGRRPVINVSWVDVQEYIRWLNSWSDGGFRLPSEAEWEYACRAGTTSRWSFGDDEAQLGEYAWYGGIDGGNSQHRTHPVGERQPNAWGLHDMHGNVAEWVADAYHRNYKGNSQMADQYGDAPDDGSAWVTGGDTTYRLLRGGSWSSPAKATTSAFRISVYAHGRDARWGFRLARSGS